MIKIVLISRYSMKIMKEEVQKIDQEFFDLEFARMNQEREMEIEWEREELTRIIITGHGEYYWKKWLMIENIQ